MVDDGGCAPRSNGVQEQAFCKERDAVLCFDSNLNACLYRMGEQLQCPSPVVQCFALNHTELSGWVDLGRLRERFDGLVMERYLAKAERMRYNAGMTAELGVGLLLAGVLGARRDDQLVIDVHGKPDLADDSHHIGISHTHTYVVLGVCDAELGIDVEQVPSELRRLSLPALQRGYRVVGVDPDLPGEPTPQDFARAWTRLEAITKAEGTGLFAGEWGSGVWGKWSCVWSELPSHMVCAATAEGLPLVMHNVDPRQLLLSAENR